MKEKISVLMDGELDDRAAAELIGAVGRDAEALEAWRMYHVVGDAIRGTAPLAEGFSARVSWKIAEEPAVLAPRGLPRPEPRKWFALSAAASIAAVALVGYLAFAPQQPSGPAPATAQAPGPVAQATVAPPKPSIVPLSTATNDYLLAHQGFSPRLYLQGMAPYVRTVSDSREMGREAGK